MLLKNILNRYVYRYIVLTPLLLATIGSNVTQAQVVLKGDTEGSPGAPKLLTYEQCEGNDLKITILKNGLLIPVNQGYIAGQDLTNNKYILLFPALNDDEDNVTFTILSAINKDNKTFTHTHVITFKRPKPLPKPVIPDPVKPDPVKPVDTLQESLNKAYNVAPNPQQLALIIQIMEEVRKGIKDEVDNKGKAIPDDYKTFDDIQTTFKNTANKYVKFNDLRALRDTLGDYQLKKWGVDPRRYDHVLARDVMDELITKLKQTK